jgi:protein-S-isoprenylcysteine O-methyltransferase Ste14
MELILYSISMVCLWILFSAIVLNFYFAQKNNIVKEKKSIVDTGSMLAFFLANVVLVYLGIGAVFFGSEADLLIMGFGTALVVFGTAVNIAGRLVLKQNWGNQIEIHENHTLVQTGVYRHIRHPLYASTILMMYGFALLFSNWVVFLLNTAVFIPFMMYRAKQEDVVLAAAFPGIFPTYQSQTGLFVPRLKKETKTHD